MLVVHIGPRKTASTYLQQNFYLNRKELLKKGWLYPILSVNAQNAHHDLVTSIPQLRSGKGRLSRAMSKAGRLARSRGANILVSSENLSKWQAGDFRLLAERFGEKDMLIVYTLRDPIDRMVSVWGETVKTGKALSLKSYAQRHLRDPFKSRVLNPLLDLEPIRSEARLSLTVLDYEALAREGGDIYQAFGRHILGLEGLRPAKVKRSNESFPPEVLDYLRLLAREMNYDPSTAERLLSRQFLRCHQAADIEKIANAIRAAGGAETLTFSRDEEWYATLQRNILNSVGPLIVPPPSTERSLFDGGTVTAPSHDIDRLAQMPDVANLLAVSAERMRSVSLPFKRSRIAQASRYLRRLISV